MLTYIKGDKRSTIHRDWEPWLKQTSKFYDRYLDEEFYPTLLDMNEQAIVSLFMAGAALAGNLALAEYSTTKKLKKDRRKNASGRADFWMTTNKRSYSFEFKRAYHEATPENLKKMLDVAIEDIESIKKSECDHRVAVVVAATSDLDREEYYRDFAGEVHFVYHIGPQDENGAYIYFFVLNYPS